MVNHCMKIWEIYLGMQKKVMQYFSGVINVNLENITYDNLHAMSSQNIEDILHQPDTKDEFE